MKYNNYIFVVVLKSFVLLYSSFCFAKDYRIYDKNSNYLGRTKDEGNCVKFYDKNFNYKGYSKEKGNTTEFYDKNSNLKGSTRGDFYNKTSEIYDNNSNLAGFSKKENSSIKTYDKHYNQTEFYEED